MGPASYRLSNLKCLGIRAVSNAFMVDNLDYVACYFIGYGFNIFYILGVTHGTF